MRISDWSSDVCSSDLNSLAYAKDRLQSRSLTGPKNKDKPADTIIVHPDVRRMLLTQKANNEAARMLCYWVGLMIDQSHKHPDTQVREDADDLVALLTPIVKAFITHNALDGTNLQPEERRVGQKGG